MYIHRHTYIYIDIHIYVYFYIMIQGVYIKNETIRHVEKFLVNIQIENSFPRIFLLKKRWSSQEKDFDYIKKNIFNNKYQKIKKLMTNQVKYIQQA